MPIIHSKSKKVILWRLLIQSSIALLLHVTQLTRSDLDYPPILKKWLAVLHHTGKQLIDDMVSWYWCSNYELAYT